MNAKIIAVSGVSIVALVAIVFAMVTPFKSEIFSTPNGGASFATSTPGFMVTHVATPEAVKGIYMTSYVAGSEKSRSKLIDLIVETELNTVVVDIKDYTGKISFISDDPKLKAIGSEEERIIDIKEFIGRLHEKGIYVIGRISTFQDPYLARIHPEYAVQTKAGKTWADRKGVTWVDAGASQVWDYLAHLGEVSYSLGFDEINFDYIRFPSDGNMDDIAYPFSAGKVKSQVLKEFFVYVDQRFRAKGIPISADLFGMTTNIYGDLGIGQVFENALAHFDFVYPMVYPSHYPAGFNGIANPNSKPYEVIHFAMSEGLKREKALQAKVIALQNSTSVIATSTASVSDALSFAKSSPTNLKNAKVGKVRPWLQDFSLYKVNYGPAEVRAQIQATYDVGINSWILWNASNVYTKEALLPKI